MKLLNLLDLVLLPKVEEDTWDLRKTRTETVPCIFEFDHTAGVLSTTIRKGLED